MRITEKTLGKLDFNALRERLAGYCHLAAARGKALALLPSADFAVVRGGLQETDEGRALLRFRPSFSVRGSKEIHDSLDRCEHGGMLMAMELADMKDTLRTARQVRSGIMDMHAVNAAVGQTSLRSVAALIVPLKPLEDLLNQSISDEGEVTDRASAELANLRDKISAARQRVKSALDQVVRSAAYQKMLQDHVVTTRADRYVVPVKQEYASSFPGIVHDQSASGATVFMEPMAVVQTGNQLRELIMREKREVERILRLLTGKVSEDLDDIRASYQALIDIDFILAKARMASDMRAEAPELLRHREISLVQARHPLLEGDVVPLTVELGGAYDWLVVTGPNTGGKTVALKTLALMVIMTQCGLHIPIQGYSRLGVFEALFADIGDEQSVEQSLSTFSGHMANVIEILAEADAASLVFFDEIGAGTDPSEGAALAMAILEELLNRGCHGMATTHYGALKSFAYHTPRLENASVEFDAETLCPTYRLISGIPGRSNAFVIARRLGLARDILNKAQGHLSERQSQTAHLLENLEESLRDAESRKAEMQKERDALELRKTELAEALADAREQGRAQLQKARDQAVRIVQETREESQRIIKGIKAAQKSDRRGQDKAIEQARQMTGHLEEIARQGDHAVKRTPVAPRLDQIVPGQKVFLTNLEAEGVILAPPDKNKEVAVQMGVLKTTVPLAEISLPKGSKNEENRKEKKGAQERVSFDRGLDKAKMVRSEIDVRGNLVDEAMEKLDKYLDDAVLGGVNLVSIIHGKGTGALRAGVHAFLKGHPLVADFRLGEVGEGDSGVTIVRLM